MTVSATHNYSPISQALTIKNHGHGNNMGYAPTLSSPVKGALLSSLTIVTLVFHVSIPAEKLMLKLYAPASVLAGTVTFMMYAVALKLSEGCSGARAVPSSR